MKGYTAVLMGLLVLWLAGALGGCGSGQDEFTTPDDAQRVVSAGEALTITLDGGYVLSLPGTLFEHDTILLFSKHLAAELTPGYFPTATKEAGDMLCGVVINTPADVWMHGDMQLTFGLPDAGLAAGTVLIVYRFDRENLYWSPWGHTAAVVAAGGATATCTLPTTGFLGFVGSTALFKGMTADTLPVGAQTVIQGTVVDVQSQPVATDVAVNVLVGALKYPAAVLNGRTPTGGTVANTVDSGADGTFTISVPDNLVGQYVNLEFGSEDPNHGTQGLFDILAPAVERTAVTYLIVRFGENNVRSQPVGAG
jgi:hypothetical protein